MGVDVSSGIPCCNWVMHLNLPSLLLFNVYMYKRRREKKMEAMPFMDSNHLKSNGLLVLHTWLWLLIHIEDCILGKFLSSQSKKNWYSISFDAWHFSKNNALGYEKLALRNTMIGCIFMISTTCFLSPFFHFYLLLIGREVVMQFFHKVALYQIVTLFQQLH